MPFSFSVFSFLQDERVSPGVILMSILLYFVSGSRVLIYIYIPNCKHQVKPHLSPLPSAACAAAIDHRNHFVHLCHHNKSSVYKSKFKQRNHYKRMHEAAKFVYANKTKSVRCWLLHLIKESCLLKSFLKTLVMMIQVSLYLLSLQEVIGERYVAKTYRC